MLLQPPGTLNTLFLQALGFLINTQKSHLITHERYNTTRSQNPYLIGQSFSTTGQTTKNHGPSEGGQKEPFYGLHSLVNSLGSYDFNSRPWACFYSRGLQWTLIPFQKSIMKWRNKQVLLSGSLKRSLKQWNKLPAVTSSGGGNRCHHKGLECTLPELSDPRKMAGCGSKPTA